MKHSKTKIVLLVLSILFLAGSSQAISEEKMKVRWRYSFPPGVGCTTVGDADGDGEAEVLVALKNNTLQLYNAAGGLKREVDFGPVKDHGIPYAIVVADVDGDGVNETVVGFGGHRVVIQHPWDEYFNLANKSVGRHEKFLARSIRNKGSLRVYGSNFTVRWEYKTNLSVQDLAVFDFDDDGTKEIAVALGGHLQDDFWERGEDFPGGVENWTIVEYPILNGSVLLLNSNGERNWSHTFNSSLGDMRVRSVAAGFSSTKTAPIVVVGVEDGQYRVFNATSGSLRQNYSLNSTIIELNLGRIESAHANDVLASGSDRSLHLVDASGRTLWKARFFGEITSTQLFDLDADEANDIFAANRDGYLYVLNSDGSQKWKYLIGEPVYSISVLDLDLNGLPEMVFGSLGNVTVTEFRNEYFTRVRADGFYDRAFREFEAGDYLLARVLLDKSEDLYSRLGLELTKIGDLRSMIARELLVDKKIRADYLYQKALEAYGLNNYNESFRLIEEARLLYADLNNTAGIKKAESLENKIKDELRKTQLIRADSLYTQALSYYGFKDYDAAEENARKAKSIYESLGEDEGVRKSGKIILDLAAARYDKAKKLYIGFDFDLALLEAEGAERLYLELGNDDGVNQSRELMSEIRAASVRKEPSFPDRLRGLLPLFIVVLVVVLLLSLFSRKRIKAKDAEEIAESIEEEMGLIPPKEGGDLEHPP